MRRWKRWLAVLTAAVMLGGVGVQAQRAPRMRPGMAPRMEQFRQRMMERLRERLGATEEEWKVISPLLQDVLEKQRTVDRALMAVRMRMFMGERRGPAPQMRTPPSLPQEVQGLVRVLQNKNASPKEIKARLDAFRKWRAEQEKALKQAREKLRQVLTVRQEAQLVLLGILD